MPDELPRRIILNHGPLPAHHNDPIAGAPKREFRIRADIVKPMPANKLPRSIQGDYLRNMLKRANIKRGIARRKATLRKQKTARKAR